MLAAMMVVGLVGKVVDELILQQTRMHQRPKRGAADEIGDRKAAELQLALKGLFVSEPGGFHSKACTGYSG
jgi:hypothetical protein